MCLTLLRRSSVHSPELLCFTSFSPANRRAGPEDLDRMAGARAISVNTICSLRLSSRSVATFLFLICILGVTQKGAPSQFAGLAIGLTLVAIHIVGINVTGVSVNPARSLGPAIVGAGTNPGALAQVWLFIIAPLIGAGIAGVLFKSGGVLAADDV